MVRRKKAEAVKEMVKPTSSDRLAVVSVLGKQYLVREGTVLRVANSGEEVGKKISGIEVLLYQDGQDCTFGSPLVEGVNVEAEVIENFKAKKIDVIKFKAKSRYSKKIGYRSQVSKLKVLKITAEGGSRGS